MMSVLRSPIPFGRLLLAVLLLVSAGPAWGQTIYISEVVASNEDSLLDEDGQSPDWIELYNSSDSAVDLSGWHLTDDLTVLNKWTFPATTIAAKGFLIVFASDKDRAVSGAELHTNFKLSASGESLALVRADGSTIEDSHDFGPLLEDQSYGHTFSFSDATVLLDAGAACSARIPTSSSDSAGWRELLFSGSGWVNGSTGVGYEAGSGAGYWSLLNLNVLSMRG